MKAAVTSVDVWRTRQLNHDKDLLAVEEPLQLRLEYGDPSDRSTADIAVTMRTPGNDFELALGFLFTEGIVTDRNDIQTIRYCLQVKDVRERDNVVRISLKPGVDPGLERLKRNFFTSSSCGVCGKTSIDQVKQLCASVQNDYTFVAERVISAPDLLRKGQKVFEYTGGLHASGLFDKSGDLILLREDIGRHNALDKVIGAALEMNKVPLRDHFLVVSGRASFELIQKALMAGIPLVAAVGAPSSLAVELAKQGNMTLLGFVKRGNFNIYCGREHLKI
ncbi:formate dehydrogenase accessory sulfurtransferase FdhD [Fulvivirga sedimenti]|uniref:Sulfur carrier protein FdhD n=1 Tax=Fulvivirga sedimenti TaxID=2879465 RepID=A0A9X1HN71_9BACT|nr:formate dehydrogenase accessory sulfurtransferase FdhD [Fulvivirga sedimenti]MCA6075253.1 formate dehydrogenase accessory sulfurtransferase FdhD [Fulvivirga sedimenti]MCA6076430.1 formate dehydrogenase accessory sulfurtransferase FdhD [Fulvivirga sedimenti]MCA6077558.1 formate dehydrogenase accessory sulfurtransferase FdhD [Fulvivirga sedimenti]